MHPVALTIAGSDSGGGAGIQADLKTFEAGDAFGTSAITAVTAQNTHGVTHSDILAPETVRAQIDAVTTDFDVSAVKTGMLGDAAVVDAVATALAETPAPVTVDPVVVSQSGDRLLTESGIAAVRDELLPRATLATPNIPEAELLADTEITDETDLRAAAEAVCELGPDATLLTGGHLDGDPVDVFAGDTTSAFTRPRIETPTTHGSGCTLSAAITARLAHGDALRPAVERGIDAVAAAIDGDLSVGGGDGPVDHRRATATPTTGVGAGIRAVRDVVAMLEAEWPPALVPEVGMNVAVAPPAATTPADVVAVDGRLHATTRGVRAAGGIEPGASSHIARFLLGVRAHDADVTAATNVRWSAAREDALGDRWDTVSVDRTTEPADADGTMDWTAQRVMAGRDSAPDAVVDSGAVGKEAMVRVLAADADALTAKLRTVASLERDADVA
ncbi:bifunctional hydroxymethylpyrimidine kinase/phosphomethylpyrimidine kinase [Halobacterium salinarum]|uniref:bifunctional hydroxymethylpyrimidine kinase/phosphomethylpyrimidine kinase n=1 Tax=Halobacterium salinarum TaxID=2242 RepID=UPI001F41CB2C|nr:bifunctional hydroxymethylpyrimidine kinase/phosphomethylpyrimidine kinase [Halobacterium salinarum]MCF2206219.1 bifunctional hydroxymethylpyrimidine kinase/phosphomethylpyrimidine kinase [Halobacterium salinarum]